MKKSPIALALAGILTVAMSAPVLAADSDQSMPSAEQSTGGAAGNQTEMNSNTQMHRQEGTDTGSSANMEQSGSTGTQTTAYNPKDYDGKDVVNAKGDKVGEVDKLVVSTGDQKVYAVVGVGGFLGIGEKDVAIPLEQLQPQGDKLALSSGITEDELKNSMRYKESEFSAFEPEGNANGDANSKPAPDMGGNKAMERGDTTPPKSQY